MSKTLQEQTHELRQLGEGAWIMAFPLQVLGDEHGRIVTLLRLSSGKLIIHSTAPFSEEDVSVIRAVGEPAWLVEGDLHHDTFAHEGHAAFPDLPYLAPPGFSETAKVETRPILPAPTEWQGEVEVVKIKGVPSFSEHVFFHRASRTLVVTDLVQNFTDEETTWEWLLRHYAMGLKGHPAVNRLLSSAVKDEAEFGRSIRSILEWDFDRIVVGHKEPIETDARARFRQAIQRNFPKLLL